MGFKSVRREALEEGPMDFARGAAGAMGQKVAGAARNVGGAIANTARDINAAGAQASAVGNFEKALQQFAQLLAQYDQLKAKLPKQEEPEPEQQQQAQQGVPANAVPDQFRTTEKPKGRMGKHGFEYTFNSYMQSTHGERIDEGVWDFVKGAGSAVAGKMKEKINSYANGAGDTFRDIYKAGSQASAEGNARAAQQKFEQVDAQIKQVGKNLMNQLKAFGPKGAQVLKAALAKVPQQMQRRIMNIPQFKAVVAPPLQQQP